MRRTYKENGRGLYRSRRGLICGVCRGIAEYFDISVFWTRFAVIILFFVTGVWPLLGLYVLAALLMKPEPVVPFNSEADREFYDSYANSRSQALSRLKRTFESLEQRLRRLEDIITTKEYDWDRRMNGS